MGGVGLRPRARRDLDEIATFTNERWGASQRRRYLALLGEAMKKVALHPELGRSRAELGPDFRSLRAGRHVIFYRALVDGVEVVRILHDAMDPALHLFLEEH